MRQISGKEFARVLERKGWLVMRTQGSHHIYGKADSTVRISVPIHGSKPLKTGLAKHLSKMADLTDVDLQ